jgi:hypothetical protein
MVGQPRCRSGDVECGSPPASLCRLRRRAATCSINVRSATSTDAFASANHVADQHYRTDPS